MHIGIIQCDDVLDQYQPEFGNYPAMLQNLFLSVDPELRFTVYAAHKMELPEHLDECDAYLSTGSIRSAYDELDWITQLIEFLRQVDHAEKKFVGICFGHQLFAKAFGGLVEKSPHGWGVGISFNDIIEPQPWMQPFQSKMDLIVSHQDQITQLPEDTKVLARSDFCDYYMLQRGNHILTMQGHPEFSVGYITMLANSRLERIGASRIRQAMTSLKAPADDTLMTQWILNFMRNEISEDKG